MVRSSGGCKATRRRRLSLRILAGVAALVAACAVPEAPEWDVGVILPFSGDPISIVDLLPDIVSTEVVGGQPVFTVELQQDSVDYSLGVMCSACAVLHGQTTNVSTFDYTDSLDVLFVEDLISVELVQAKLGLRIQNFLNFDPLRPHPDPDSAGYLSIQVRDLTTGALLDSTFLSGSTDSLPSGRSRLIEIDLRDVTVTRGLRTIAQVHSPLDAQQLQIDTAMNARFGTYLDEIFVAALTAVVELDTIEEAFIVDFDRDLRQEINDRIQRGSFEFELTHDFEFDGSLDVSIAGSFSDLYSGDPAAEVRLMDFDLSYAPNGRVTTREVTPAELELLANFPEVWVGYQGVTTGSNLGPTGRPVSRFTPDQSLQADFTVTTFIRVGS